VPLPPAIGPGLAVFWGLPPNHEFGVCPGGHGFGAVAPWRRSVGLVGSVPHPGPAWGLVALRRTWAGMGLGGAPADLGRSWASVAIVGTVAPLGRSWASVAIVGTVAPWGSVAPGPRGLGADRGDDWIGGPFSAPAPAPAYWCTGALVHWCTGALNHMHV